MTRMQEFIMNNPRRFVFNILGAVFLGANQVGLTVICFVGMVVGMLIDEFEKTGEI